MCVMIFSLPIGVPVVDVGCEGVVEGSDTSTNVIFVIKFIIIYVRKLNFKYDIVLIFVWYVPTTITARLLTIVFNFPCCRWSITI